MNKPTTEKAIKFLAKDPTFIGRVGDVDFYEHPTWGDELPLVAIMPSGMVRMTSEWELPSADDFRGLF